MGKQTYSFQDQLAGPGGPFSVWKERVGLVDNLHYNNSDIKHKVLYYGLELAEVGVHIVDKSGVTLFYNRSAEKMDGLKREDLLGRSMTELVESGIFSSSVALEVIESHQLTTITQMVNGRCLRAKAVPYFEKNQLEAVFVYIMDIDALERLSRELKEIKLERDRLETDLSKYKVEYLKEDQLLYNSKKMQRVVSLGEKVAVVDSTILIEGESGVGKTMFAKHIHDFSMRKDKSFIKVDCSAIPENLVESELFGYVEGSFTGAVKGGKKGLIEEASGGTLFLDEIAELPLSSQVKLLTTMQERTIQPVGSTERKSVDIRIISATNQNLAEMVDEGKFREDLFYRLKVIPITIPPLRERKEDIVVLIKLFIQRLNLFYSLEKNISPKGLSLLLDYSWPGNVRELENVIERLLVTSEGDEVTEDEVRLSLSSSRVENIRDKTFKELVEAYQIRLIERTSHEVGSIKELAVKLKINESTLRKKIDRFGIDMKF